MRRGLSRPAAALTFEPHPRAFFNSAEPLFRLTDEAGKLRLLASTGLGRRHRAHLRTRRWQSSLPMNS